jgi:hypothetical protein
MSVSRTVSSVIWSPKLSTCRNYPTHIDVSMSTANECHIHLNGDYLMYLSTLMGSTYSRLLEELFQTRTCHGLGLNERL